MQTEIPGDLAHVFDIQKPKPQAYQWLRFGEIRPAGWIKAQMQDDLENGYLGRLDRLAPDLLVKDDIYGADRLTRHVKTKDVGAIVQDAGWEVMYLWWNSESQSNWWDALTRTALLLENPVYLAKAKTHVEHILATQDADGYLGIYAPDLRYNFEGENGEFWAQATLLRGLLGYYEFTGEEKVLEAVERAVQNILRAYPIHASQPFTVRNSYGGVTHGLAITDVLDRLQQLTGNAAYGEYALWLYQEFSLNPFNENDVQYARLVDPALRFQAHGVHTYEHLRSLLAAVYASGSPWLEQALAGYLARLEPCLAPSGGPIGDESIGRRRADPGETGYEYCSIHELLDSYTHLLQKEGAARWADRSEWLLFNAGQGARDPHASAIAYLKTDTSYSMTGPLHAAEPQPESKPQTRYKYSPVHQDVAACCAPNAGRIYPYYVKAMWMRSPQGLAALLYGPCEVQTQVNGVAVHISEKTRYPFDLEVQLDIEPAQPVNFELALRKPAWADAVQVGLPAGAAFREVAGSIRLNHTWSSGDRVTLKFQTGVRVNAFREGEHFVSYGPLLFVQPLEGLLHTGRQYAGEAFCDRYYSLANPETSPELLALPVNAEFQVLRSPFQANAPWTNALSLEGSLFHIKTQQVIHTRLVPMGGSALRKATFKMNGGLQ